MNDKVYWIWLQQTLGISPSVKTDEIEAYFGTGKAVYFAGENEWRLSGIFTPRQLDKLTENRDLTKAQKLYNICASNNWHIVTPDDKNYPQMLFRLPNFPLVLYVNGNLDCLKNKITVAVVGTREPTMNSAVVARALCASITRSGGVIISGGALGIDAAAHSGALDEQGSTVAVLGCGLDCNYPVANEALRREITRNGAVITEYPPGTRAMPANFPIRNRLISGLSYGTVVIEAGVKSGSLITARYALDQGRDVFAVPGDVVSSGFSGTNKLIRDGAKPVFNAMDVLEDYAVRYPELIDIEKIENELKVTNYNEVPTVKKETKPPKKEKVQTKFVKKDAPPHLSENARKLYCAFDAREMQAEELILKTGLGVSEFAAAMTELELFDTVELQAGKNYKLK